MTRIGLDANILLRTLLDDDLQQSMQARRLLSELSGERKGYVGVTAMLEVFWVLNMRNRVPRDRVTAAFTAMLTLEHIEYEAFDSIKRAINAYLNDSVDFPDALLCDRNKEAECHATMTFDKKAAERVPGMELLQ